VWQLPERLLAENLLLKQLVDTENTALIIA
jgi:hypothetical protein